MTKTIEIVDREIKFLEEQIIKYEIHLFAFPQLNVENRLEEMKEDLQTLEQIKCELEAWEVVKKYCKEKSINGIVFEHIINVSHTKQNYEIVKKALEVEDE